MVYLWSVLSLGGLTAALAGLLIVSERLLVDYGVCKLDINSGEEPLEVDGGDTLLSTLYANEIFIPSACGGKGTCGHCKITVTAGGGRVLPTETPYLSRKEIRSNVRLACQVKIREDIFVRIPEELLNVQMFSSVVESVRELTYDIKEMRLRLTEPMEISHRPGQYVQIQVSSAGEPIFRAYSISSSIAEPNIVELVVRLIPGGICSTYLHSLNVGDGVNFTGPYGEFVLNEDPSVEVVCVGGGCGMAPMKNIIYSLYERWPERSCWLFFGCRTTHDIFYLEQFEKLARKHPNFHVVYAMSEKLDESEQWEGDTGFVHLSVDKCLGADVKRQAFLCGPPLMIEAVTGVLREKGLRSKDIFYDEF
ncbi:MAG: 2Fe-2S iron-sulfur cluster binding domain-containing protein [Planctomycetes bacterium]|nr:2Fe-2S iron-sulfur cluster binding domain-containing protein [Planctomycetota bacterium]